MRTHPLRAIFALLAALTIAIALAACGDDESTTSADSGEEPAAP